MTDLAEESKQYQKEDVDKKKRADRFTLSNDDFDIIRKEDFEDYKKKKEAN